MIWCNFIFPKAGFCLLQQCCASVLVRVREISCAILEYTVSYLQDWIHTFFSLFNCSAVVYINYKIIFYNQITLNNCEYSVFIRALFNNSIDLPSLTWPTWHWTRVSPINPHLHNHSSPSWTSSVRGGGPSLSLRLYRWADPLEPRKGQDSASGRKCHYVLWDQLN